MPVSVLSVANSVSDGSWEVGWQQVPGAMGYRPHF